MNTAKHIKESLKVLVVDDEESIRFALGRVLTKAGYDVSLAYDFNEANALIEQQDFDIAIIDRILPDGKNGLDIIRLVKSKSPLCEVILVSGYPTFKSARESMMYGTLAYIPKPFTHEDINLVVKKAEQKVVHNKAAEEYLIEAGNLSELGLLSAQIAHEINDPLQIITGNLELMLEDTGIDKVAQKRIALIHEAAQSIKKLNSDLREFARPHNPSFSLIKPDVPLENALDFLSKTGAIKFCNIVRCYADDTPCIKGDEFQLCQAVINLILNALRAMETADKKDLCLKTEYSPESGRVHLSVGDTGCGIPKRIMDKIFNGFFTTWASNGGTGLGLSLVKKIIEKHNGSIHVESDMGKGTVFTVSLPAAVYTETLVPE